VKAFTERRPKVIGAIAIVVMAAVVAAVVFLNRSTFESGYRISARFPNAAGISKGSNVLLAGVNVGSVGSVTLSGNHVNVTMTIDNGVRLPHHTAANVQVETLLGGVDVTLEPVSGWNHPLRSGAVLTDTGVPTEFYQLNNVAGHLLEHSNAKALNTLVQDMATITKGKQTQVAEIIEGLEKLTTTVSDRSAEVGQLIDSSKTLATTLAQHDQQLATAVSSLDTVASGLADHSTQLASLIDNVEAMAAQTNGLLSKDRPGLQSLVKNLTVTLGVVNHHQDDLAQAVSYLGAAIKGFSSIGYSGSTPLTWANIYVSTTGLSGTSGVLGACGALTTALDDALGPTPLPCATRTGPLTGSTSPLPSTPSTGSGGAGATKGSASRSESTTSGGLSAPNTGVGGLSQLLAPLTGGR
jgi:phospholipid/cholesterol/gamma-HCH transport system substrate-binding protein